MIPSFGRKSKPYVLCQGSLHGSPQPGKREQKTDKCDEVERFSEPRPKSPARDSRGQFCRWRGVKRDFLKRQHLADEIETTPHTHDDIRAESDEQEAAHLHLPPREDQR